MKTSMHLSFSINPIVLSIATMIASCGTNIKGEHSAISNEIVAKLTRYEVKPEHLETFRKALSDYVLFSLSEGSNILSEGYFEQENPAVLWVIERCSNRAELEKISNSSTAKVIASLSGNALAQTAKAMYAKDLEPLSKQQWRNVENKNDKPITIMLFVDSKAGTEENFKAAYHTAIPQFRSEPGVINYQLSQLEENSTQFVTYEKFRDEAAFQFHLKFPPIQPVIDYLLTNIKKQPFQNGLHRLIPFAQLKNE
ncbi:MAG: antibiotic biosynthesis monooxygenase [Ferruginibacter sp.]